MLAYNDIDLNQPISKDIEFVDKFLNNHYSSFKLDYMYNYLDFFSNKYRIRKKIVEEMKSRVGMQVLA